MADPGDMATTPEKSETAKREEAILAFWNEHKIFEKSLEKEAPKGNYIFYEGPPTANGRPGVHHMESRSFKDAIPRYKTMRGYRVPRRAGWDTHGLPVELEVEKQLGFKGKKDIEEYGIAAFNKMCRESVFKYIAEWERFTHRVGYWVDQSKAYFTFDVPYMESLLSIFKKISDDGHLYKDYRVVPWCSRCGTALSTHELAQGYEDVRDLSLTVKFELVDEPGTYLLAWTTTPWTLPGNVGLAIGEKVAYGEYEKDGEKVILANSRAKEVLTDDWKYLGPKHVANLIGLKYKPLYPYAQELASEAEKQKFGNAFQVYLADFVTDEDGTGIVHTAVMYGQEDFELGQKVGLPKVHLVSPDGRFISGTGFLEGRFVKDEYVAVDILKDLQERGLFFAKENHLHSYPFCWRCKTPLIYYARDSWYIRMSQMRPTLVSENQKIHWEPEHIRDGRMGEWLKGDKDWAISRERYWGTPLPIWQSDDGSERLVVGSIAELKERTKKSGNKYFVMRHGEAEHNVKGITSSSVDDDFGLTETGRKQAEAQAEKLKGASITHIYASPFRRARETAEIIADALGLSRDSIVYDDTLREVDFGDLNGKPFEEFIAYETAHMPTYADKLPNGESYLDAKKRFGSFLYDLEKIHSDSVILMVSHGVALETLKAVVEGADDSLSKKIIDELSPKPGEMMDLDFVPLPHNDNYELDLHRPYIDDVVLVGDSGAELRRVKEVMDVWFDSGSMPFAQDHYPFENKQWIDTEGYPADFISEAIDQTRGWFYTLLAVGVLMGKGTPYLNVICLGHLLDEKGQKMSKSKGNVVEPMAAMDKYGADTLRFWMYSVNQPGDSKNFDEKTVNEVANKVFNPFINSLTFYESYGNAGAGSEAKSVHVMDRWIRARFARAVSVVTEAVDRYDLFSATREIREFIGDLSQWYVRRSRDRMRSGDDAAQALATLRTVLRDTAKLLAPFAPFSAEYVYLKVRTEDEPESVHLSSWPEVHEDSFWQKLVGGSHKDEELLENMTRVRSLASEALMMRQKAGVKVRQPLGKLSIPGELPEEFAELLKEEVNVKEVMVEAAEMSLDTNLTPELVREGDVREFMRALADARKEKNLSPRDVVTLTVDEAAHELLGSVSMPGVSKVMAGSIVDGFTVELSSSTARFTFTTDAS
ncbi:MAG: class I tRNA ligase family protein [Candidatus Pacebacteria bacterium]|nr:class I tRNA ligase family protein [Candidatus Paceibacterota bacterium]